MKEVSRRQFLTKSAAVATGALTLPLGQNLWARQPDISFPTSPRDRLSVTSWPFRAYIESPSNRFRDPSKPGMTLIEFAAMVENRFGIHNINPLSWHFASTELSYLTQFRQALEKRGLRLVNLGLGGGAFYDPDPQRRREAVNDAKKWIDVAVIMGSPGVRPQINEPHRLRPNVDHAASAFGQVAEYGAKKNIVVDMENDDPVTQDPFFIAKVIDKVGNPYLRALPDFGNSAVKGPEFNAKALTVMFQHAYNMSHVKDTVEGPHGQVIRVDVAKAFAIAKASGYRGYFSMEYDMDSGDPFSATQRLVRLSLENLS
jgi:sugar phosphate isomerase/epimerase